MSRISFPASPAEQTKPLLAAVQRQLGVVPNLMKTVGISPVALEGYLSLNGALARGRLPAALRERIALAIAQLNGCEYCLAAHTYIGASMAGIGGAEINAARHGESSDPKTSAALRFALRVARERGRIGDADLAVLREAGFDDAETIEIVLHVALNVLTNYVNNVAQTEVDFPRVPLAVAA